MKEWILYIIECRDETLYTGITTDLKKRLRLHNDGKAAKYTRNRRPVKLKHTEIFKNESLSRKREAVIKSLPRARKVEMIKQAKNEDNHAF